MMRCPECDGGMGMTTQSDAETPTCERCGYREEQLSLRVAWILAGLGVMLMLWAAVGCSSGLKEVAFIDNAGHYVVDRSLVNDRMTSTQPHASGVFLCKRKITSEQMAVLRQDGEEHSYYAECEPATQYALTGDQPILTLYKGFGEAAIIGGSIGTGLALSGDTITQKGGSSSTSVGVTTNVKQKATVKGRR